MLLKVLKCEDRPKVTLPCRNLDRARSVPRVEAVEAISTLAASGQDYALESFAGATPVGNNTRELMNVALGYDMPAFLHWRLPVDDEFQSRARDVTVLLLNCPIPHLGCYFTSLVGAVHTTNHGPDRRAQLPRPTGVLDRPRVR